MKKVYLLPLAAMALTALAGCGQQDSRPVLVYRSWDYGTETQNNEERQLIKAFEEKNNCRVKCVENVGTGSFYWENVVISMDTGVDLADVVNLPTISDGLADQYLLNIKELVNADPEYSSIPEILRSACSFKSGVYAIPARMNLQGYFANVDIIETVLNISVDDLNVNSPYSKIEQIINKAADTFATNKVVGLSSAAHFIDAQPSVLDTTNQLGYFTWDGTKYNLDSGIFKNAVNQAKELFTSGKTLDSFSGDQKTELGLDPEIDPIVDAWNKGKLALRYGYTYEAPDMLEKDTSRYEYRFIGNPGGKISIVGDYYGIYKNTKNAELAYTFAKWMPLGKDGFTKRMELFKKKGTINSLPLTDDETVIEDYFSKFGNSTLYTGLQDAFTKIHQSNGAMPEGAKVVPGFFKSRNDITVQGATVETPDETVQNPTMFNLLDYCYKGYTSIENYLSGTNNLNTLANEQYNNWMNKNAGKYQ